MNDDKQTHFLDRPTALDQAVSELMHVGASSYLGPVVPISVRLPLDLYGWIEAFAKASGLSRNKVMEHVASVAVEQLQTVVPGKRWEHIRGLHDEYVFTHRSDFPAAGEGDE